MPHESRSTAPRPVGSFALTAWVSNSCWSPGRAATPLSRRQSPFWPRSRPMAANYWRCCRRISTTNPGSSPRRQRSACIATRSRRASSACRNCSASTWRIPKCAWRCNWRAGRCGVVRSRHHLVVVRAHPHSGDGGIRRGGRRAGGGGTSFAATMSARATSIRPRAVSIVQWVSERDWSTPSASVNPPGMRLRTTRRVPIGTALTTSAGLIFTGQSLSRGRNVPPARGRLPPEYAFA